MSLSALPYIIRIASNYPLLSREEEVRLARRIIRRERKAINTMILHNLRLLIRMAREHAGRGLEFDDLVGFGYPGLVTAVMRYKGNLGHKFSTYAVWWIKQAIVQAIMKHGRTIRVPTHTQDKMFKIIRATARLAAMGEGEPTVEDLAEESGWLPSRVRKFQTAIPEVCSMDASVGEKAGTSLGDFIPDQSENPAQDIARQDDFREIRRALSKLPEREAYVLLRRNGFYDGQIYTLDEIAVELKVSRERTRQIQAEGTRRLGQILVVHGMGEDPDIGYRGKNAALKWSRNKRWMKVKTASRVLKNRNTENRRAGAIEDKKFKATHPTLSVPVKTRRHVLKSAPLRPRAKQ